MVLYGTVLSIIDFTNRSKAVIFFFFFLGEKSFCLTNFAITFFQTIHMIFNCVICWGIFLELEQQDLCFKVISERLYNIHEIIITAKPRVFELRMLP